MGKHFLYVLAAAFGFATQADAAISTTPVTKDATEAAQKLYTFLADNYGKKTISGFMTGDNSGSSTLDAQPDVQYVLQNDGKVYPALLGFDFLMTTGKNQNDSWFQGYSNNSVAMAKELWKKGGIPSFCWHWRDPSHVKNEYAPDSICGYWDYTKAFKSGSLEWNTSSDEYKYMIADIDRVSAELLKLQDAGVAVLWRPLHEGPGGWFWWSYNCTPQQYGALYRLMYDRMVKDNGVKNCIWVWNVERSKKLCQQLGAWNSPLALEGMDWYPGDEYVDIIGVDIYTRQSNTSGVDYYNQIKKIMGDNKMISLAETDYIPNINDMVADGAMWSYWMPWDNSWSNIIGKNSSAILTSNMADDRVITLDDMPGWDTYVDECSSNNSKGIYEVECSNDFQASLEGVSEKSGSGALNLKNDDDYINLNINLAAKGAYKVYVGYNSVFGYKQISCAVNGVSGVVSCGASDDDPADKMGETLVGTYDFKAGNNLVSLTPIWTWAVVDYVRIEKDDDAPTYDFKVSDVDGFKVDGAKLLDHCGNEFVMRGVNMAYTWFKGSAYNQLEAIHKYGANAVRIVLGNGMKYNNDDAASVKKIADKCKEYGMVAILEVHDVTGSDKIDDLVKAAEYFAGLADVLKGTEPYVIINIANEWHNSSAATVWRDGYVKAIPVIRNAGLRHCIMVDAGGYGQNAATIHTYGKDVLAADVDNNVIFSIHMYGSAGNTNKVIPNIDGVINQDLALCIGEFGWFHSDGDVDEEKIFAHCNEKNVGWLAWSWYGNGSPVEYLDVVKDPSANPVLSSYDNITINNWNNTQTYKGSAEWGKEVTDAWKAEAKPAVLDDCSSTEVNGLISDNDPKLFLDDAELNVILAEDADAFIADCYGRVVAMEEMKAGQNVVKIANWNAGIYFLNVCGKVNKFIKK